MLTASDYMERALFLAARGRGRTSPNPMVGAVVVDPEGIIVGWGFHARAGEPHAEIHALEMAGARARGATLYCTLEPCSHWGRTGPCAPRVVEAGIRRVVAAMRDPDPRVSGRGFALLKSHGIALDVGVGAGPAAELNRAYVTRTCLNRPFVTLKAAISTDGYVAAAPGRRTQLTSRGANRHAHRIRAEVDAIAVGSGTVLCDDPWLTVREVHRARPFTRVLFDRSLVTPPSARVLSTLDAGPVIIVTSAEAAVTARAAPLRRAGAEIEPVSPPTLQAALERLGERGVSSVLLEGGPRLHRAAWDEAVVDYVQLYVTPSLCGPQGVRFLDGRLLLTAALMDRRTRSLGPDVLIEGYVHRPH
jgi:diaminohydroxyphosphoribosylaminopyrimidine deaminase/5-amino-6-(5-phosphoribosylamino)uracil reductase